MSVPQVLMAALFTERLIVHLLNDGKPMAPMKHSFVYRSIATAILVSILHFGGFW